MIVKDVAGKRKSSLLTVATTIQVNLSSIVLVVVESCSTHHDAPFGCKRIGFKFERGDMMSIT